MPQPPSAVPCPLPSNVQLLSHPLSAELINQLQGNYTVKHKQVHYGNRLIYEDDKFGLPIPPAIPSYVQSIIDTYHSVTAGYNINRVSIRTIHPGAHIKPVAQQPVYGSILLLIPIGSHTAIQLQPVEAADSTLHRHDVIVPDRCALVLTGDALTQYQWSVLGKTRDWIDNKQVKRKETIFIECRQVKSIDEQQLVQSHTTTQHNDTDKKIVAVPVTDTTALNATIESEHVHSVYDSIAGHFSSTRHTPWPKIDHYVRSIPHNSIVADVGCGNGKYMGLNKDITVVGCDMSQPLVSICRQRGYSAVVGDAVNTPLRSDTFDYVLSIAVLHHISTVERRMQIIAELLRICKSGGEILLSAWALEQDSTSRRSFPTQDVYVPWNVPAKHYSPQHAHHNNTHKHNTTSIEPNTNTINQLLMPRAVDTPNTEELIVVHRYCHVYKQGELEHLFESTGLCDVVHTYYDRGNWCVLVRKR